MPPLEITEEDAVEYLVHLLQTDAKRAENVLKQARVPESLIVELVGHAAGSITMNRYGKVCEPRVLLEAMLKVDFALTIEDEAYATRPARRRRQ